MDSPNSNHFHDLAKPPSPARRKALPVSQSVPTQQSLSSAMPRTDLNSRSQNGTSLAKSPSPAEDKQARLLDSLRPYRATSPQQRTQLGGPPRLVPTNANDATDENSDNKELLFSTSSFNRPNVSRTAPKRAPPSRSSRQLDTGAADSSLTDSARLAEQLETSAPAPKHGNDDLCAV